MGRLARSFHAPVAYEPGGHIWNRALTVDDYLFSLNPEESLRRGYAPAMPINGYTNSLSTQLIPNREPFLRFGNTLHVDPVPVQTPQQIFEDGYYGPRPPSSEDNVPLYASRYWLDRGYAPAMDISGGPQTGYARYWTPPGIY